MNISEEIEAHIYKKFEILQKLGKGAYGIVWKAQDKKTKKFVALKKVFEAFHNATDAQRTFREVMILQELSGHENLVKLLNVIRAENNKDLYLVFDFMETDLHAVVKAGILKKVHKQYIIYQLLKGLKYIHSGEIIHRDLKPSNILINSECHIKIADFGLARSIMSKDEETEPVMTEYVATRWYRAPEIVLGSNKYSKAVDMWSVGCILAELINGKALFPGVSTMNQIELILEVLGKPTVQDLNSIESENALSIVQSISVKNKKSFSAFFKDTAPETLDFLQKCLEFNPEKRFDIEEALGHPFVVQFRDKKDEPILTEPVIISIDDNRKLSIKDYREALYNDIINKKKEERKVWRQKYMQQMGCNQASTEPSIDPPTRTLAPVTVKVTVPEKRPSLQSNPSTNQLLYQGLNGSRIAPYKTPPKGYLSTNDKHFEQESRKPSYKPFVPEQKKPVESRVSQSGIGHLTNTFKGYSNYLKDTSKDQIRKPDILKTKGDVRPNSSQPMSFGTYHQNSKIQYQKVFDQYQKLFTSGPKK